MLPQVSGGVMGTLLRHARDGQVTTSRRSSNSHSLPILISPSGILTATGRTPHVPAGCTDPACVSRFSPMDISQLGFGHQPAS